MRLNLHTDCEHPSCAFIHIVRLCGTSSFWRLHKDTSTITKTLTPVSFISGKAEQLTQEHRNLDPSLCLIQLEDIVLGSFPEHLTVVGRQQACMVLCERRSPPEGADLSLPHNRQLTLFRDCVKRAAVWMHYAIDDGIAFPKVLCQYVNSSAILSLPNTLRSS